MLDIYILSELHLLSSCHDRTRRLSVLALTRGALPGRGQNAAKRWPSVHNIAVADVRARRKGMQVFEQMPLWRAELYVVGSIILGVLVLFFAVAVGCYLYQVSGTRPNSRDRLQRF